MVIIIQPSYINAYIYNCFKVSQIKNDSAAIGFSALSTQPILQFQSNMNPPPPRHLAYGWHHNIIVHIYGVLRNCVVAQVVQLYAHIYLHILHKHLTHDNT